MPSPAQAQTHYAASWLHRALHLIGVHRAIYWGGMQSFGVRYNTKVGISGHLYFRTYRTSCRCHSAPAWNCRTRWLRGFQRGRRVAVAEEGGRAGGG